MLSISRVALEAKGSGILTLCSETEVQFTAVRCSGWGAVYPGGITHKLDLLAGFGASGELLDIPEDGPA